MSARAKPPHEGERFADLLRDAKPLAKGKARADDRASARDRSPTPRPPRPPAPPGTASAGPGSHHPERAATGRAPAFRHPDPACAHLAGAPGINDLALGRLRRGDPEPEERIDLHGTRQAEARRILSMRIESAVARGLRCVIVVHGVGRRSPNEQAILRDALPGWLERGANARHVLAFAPAPRRLGGDGATLVLLRKA